MGEVRPKDYWLEHNVAMPGEPERWVTYQADACGKLLPHCIHTDTVSVTVDESTARLIMHFSGTVISFPAAVAAKAIQDMAQKALAGVEEKNATDILDMVDAAERARARQEAQFAAEVEARKELHADTIAALDAGLAAKQAEVDSLTEQITTLRATGAELGRT